MTRARRPTGRGPILLGGLGQPWSGDLDLGAHLVDRCRARPWPPEVLVEDLSLAAQHVLHRLQEVAPRRLVLVACHPRGDPPGTIRLRVVDREPPPDADDVHLRLGESTSGVVDLDHVLAVTRWFGALPRDTVVLEVEPASVEFGTRLSPVGERALDEVVELATSEALRIASRT